MNKTVEITYKTKHTKVGDIPKDWSLDKLRKNAIVLFSNVDKHIKENEIPVSLCNYQDVYYHDYITSSIPFSAGSVKESEFYKFQLHKGDVIITKDSEDRNDIAVPAYVIEEIPNLICGYHLAILRPNEAHLDGVFLSFLLQSHNINHYFKKLANGVTRFGLTTDSIKNALIPIPPLPEQQKIAEILSTWDLAISITYNLINELKFRNKGLATKLLTGKKRLKGFSEDWEELRAAKIFQSYTDKSHNGKLEVLSATQERGVIPRSMNNIDIKFNRGALGNYKKVEIGDYVISLRSFQGGIEYSEYEGIVSPAYTVLKEILPISKTFFKVYFKTDSFISRLNTIIYGIRDGKQINYKDFSTLKLPYPPIEEQTAISKVLEQLDKEVKLYQRKLETLKEQKKGLMQQLLTGEIRVKIK
ncbi:restriction endonuclease subunit S [Flagellimonas sp.]|uniref:restriction endonuclease subunit S n=1 Tax=Flagellimonas sp. TaxID=2058762 RepID=UPI003AB38E1D